MKKASSAASSLTPHLSEVKSHTSLLMDEEALQVLPSLAVALGLDEAIVIQQLWYWLNPKRKVGRILDGHRWVFNTYAEWRESNFPFWSEIHIKRLFLKLEKAGIIISCQPDGRMSRRKYYRLSDWFVNRAKKGEIGGSERISQIRSTYPVDTIDVSSGYAPITETTLREYEQRISMSSASADGGHVFEALSPKQSKAQKLANIQTVPNFPSEAEFDQFIDSIPDGEYIAEYRPDLYDRLCAAKWHDWRLDRWTPIRNWKVYVERFAAKIRDDMPR